MNQIPKTELGKTGEMISKLGLGCMLMGTTIDESASFRMLDYYLNMDGNFLDTANCYAWWVGSGENVGDESETILGNWMKKRGNRNRIFLATKVGARLINPEKIWKPDGTPDWDLRDELFEYLNPQTIRRGVEDSLRRLKTDHIDLFYTHIDDRNTPLTDIMFELNKLVKEGKVRYIGCSNLKTWRLAEANSISNLNHWAPYVAIQQQYSYLNPVPGSDFGIAEHANDELMDYIQTKGNISLIAYSPLLKGIYNDEIRKNKDWVWTSFNWEDSERRLQKISKVAKELNVTYNQLVLAILLHQKPDIIPLVGISNWGQLVENLEAVNIKLDNDILKYLEVNIS